jgi:hypothetical protein
MIGTEKRLRTGDKATGVENPLTAPIDGGINNNFESVINAVRDGEWLDQNHRMGGRLANHYQVTLKMKS